jgi:hypothetical protein
MHKSGKPMPTPRGLQLGPRLREDHGRLRRKGPHVYPCVQEGFEAGQQPRLFGARGHCCNAHSDLRQSDCGDRKHAWYTYLANLSDD